VTEPTLAVQVWVLPSITSDIPFTSLPAEIKDQFSTLALADPQFNVESQVEMLLGTQVFSSILDGRILKIDETLPTAFNLIFGWLLTGSLPASATCYVLNTPMFLATSIEVLIDKFWTVEELDAAPPSFTDDGWCESHLHAEHKRLSSGRFQVPLLTCKSVSE